MNRPDGDPARPSTVAPGSYRFSSNEQRATSNGGYSVVWWDPHSLALDAGGGYGLRRDDLIAKDGDSGAVGARLAAYQAWQADRAAAIARARVPSVSARIATDVAGDRSTLDALAGDIETIDLSRIDGRPFGPQFGTLVHATLATVAFDADEDAVRAVARTHGRILRSAAEEVYAASEVVYAALRHPLFERVRAADADGRCYRELPIIWRAPDGALVEGTIDLAFEDAQGTTIVDFKTDREIDADAERYRRQLTIYCRAFESQRGVAPRGVLMRV